MPEVKGNFIDEDSLTFAEYLNPVDRMKNSLVIKTLSRMYRLI